MALVYTSTGATYASGGVTYTFAGVWNPNLIYTTTLATMVAEGYPLQQGSSANWVVEYDGGYWAIHYYSQDSNPASWFNTPTAPTGAPWDELQAVILGPAKPLAPTFLTAGYKSLSAVTLSWQTPIIEGVADVAYYDIYEATAANPTAFSLVGTSTTTSFTATGLAANTSYEFKVDAVDVYGASPQTAALQVSTTSFNSSSGKYFSPYIDLTQPTENILLASIGSGLRDFTIAFVTTAGLQSENAYTATQNAGEYANDGSVPYLSLGGATLEPGKPNTAAGAPPIGPGSGNPQPGTTSGPVLDTGAITAEIQQVEAEGGRITVSVGGYTGRDPGLIAQEYATYLNGVPLPTPDSATWNTNPAVAKAATNLQSEFQSAINAYGANAIDFDIENDAVTNEEWQWQSGGYWEEIGEGAAYKDDILGGNANAVGGDPNPKATAANVLRDEAIRGLEAVNPNLPVSFTLAVNANGLSNGTDAAGGRVPGQSYDDAEALLTQALTDGVRIDTVNIMAMDYGTVPVGQSLSYYDDIVNGTTNMLAAAETAAMDTHTWLMNNGFASTKVGVTIMIGQNDSYNEEFSLADAVGLATWAQQTPWVAGLGEWSLDRDNAETTQNLNNNNPNGLANSTQSGSVQSAFQFASDLNVASQAVSAATFEANKSALNAITGGFAVGDTEANIFGDMTNLEADQSHINSVYTTDIQLAVGITKFLVDQPILDKVIGGYAITGDATLITTNMNALEADAKDITSIAATNGAIAIGWGKFQVDEPILNKVTAGFTILGQSPVISANFDAVDADASHINAVSFADPNPVISITAAQVTSDAVLLAKVVGNYATDVTNPDTSVTITGHGAGLTIAGTAGGKDTITGNGSNDIFVFSPSFGHDTITDFGSFLSGATADTITLPSSEFANFAAVLADAHQSGNTTTITAQNNANDVLTLQNVTLSQLQSAGGDFKFA